MLLDALLAMFWLDGLGALRLRRVGWGFSASPVARKPSKTPANCQTPEKHLLADLGQVVLGPLCLASALQNPCQTVKKATSDYLFAGQSVCVYINICISFCKDCRGLV